MEKSLVSTGTFFSIAFALAGIYVAVLGFILGKTVLEVFTYIGFLTCIVLSIAMYISTRMPRLRILQPILITLLMVTNIVTSPDPYASIIFAATAFILFYLAGFFEKHRILKFISMLLFYYSLTVLQVFMSDPGGFFKEETRSDRGTGPLIIITIFLIFLYLAFRERLVVYLREPKPRLSLSEKGLTSVESSYFKGIVGGKSIKELAIEYEVAESTVRNTLARAYKKLGVQDKTELSVLASSSEVVS